jgi:hypothetical protein
MDSTLLKMIIAFWLVVVGLVGWALIEGVIWICQHVSISLAVI